MSLSCQKCGNPMTLDCTEAQPEYTCICNTRIRPRQTAYRDIGPEPVTKEALAEYDAAVARQRHFQSWEDMVE